MPASVSSEASAHQINATADPRDSIDQYSAYDDIIILLSSPREPFHFRMLLIENLLPVCCLFKLFCPGLSIGYNKYNNSTAPVIDKGFPMVIVFQTKAREPAGFPLPFFIYSPRPMMPMGRMERVMIPNTNYSQLKESYLFFNIAQKTKTWQEQHPGQQLLRMGIGDVSLPLCPAVISALHEAVEDQSVAGSFHGYMPECGAPFLREAIAAHYQIRGINLDPEEVFVSSGASDELGDILDLFERGQTVAIMEPAYPAYVDANLMAENHVLKVEANQEQGFLPMPEDGMEADLIYICSPNNPTGAAYHRDQLREWVNFANQKDAVILFDAAYEAFIEDPDVPHSIFEIEGARTCAIEICSLSKTAGFTGTRCGYTIIPTELTRGGMNLRKMWIRNRTTKTNGVSYIIQKGAAAVFTPEGQAQIQENLRVYKDNARILMRALDETGIWYTGGKNAPYIWMRCPAGMDSWSFFDLLLDKAQIVGTPGEGFGACGRDFFRFSTFSSPQATEEAANRLVHLLRRG